MQYLKAKEWMDSAGREAGRYSKQIAVAANDILLRINFKEVFGLDIGSSFIKAVQLRRTPGRRGYTAVSGSIVKIAAAGGSQGMAGTVEAVRESYQSAGFKTKCAVTAVGGLETAVRAFRFPTLAIDEVGGAVQLEAAQVCPFSVDSSTVVYSLLPNDSSGTRGFLAAATNSLIKKKMQMVKDADMENVLMDVEAVALLNCFTEIESERFAADRTVCILNVGNAYTTVVIMGDNYLPFVREIGYGGGDIIKMVAEECNLSQDAVANMLADISGAEGKRFSLDGSLERASKKLADDVVNTLRYYAAQERSAVVKKIFVCGGFALVKGFVEILNHNLSAEVMLWNPFDRVNCDQRQPCYALFKNYGPAMAVAAGLAVRPI